MIVVWRITDSCNLACPFCAFDRRLTFPRSEASPRDVLTFAKALAMYQSQTGDRVLLSWLGGEPFLWDPLEELTGQVRALGLDVSATTNGTALGSAELRRHICENYRELTISVDGFSDFHDAMRHWRGGFARLQTWVPLLAREAKLLNSPLKLRVNAVLMRQNASSFAALCTELTQWGIDEITFNQLGGRDRPEFYRSHRLTIADVERLEGELPEIRSRLSAQGVTLVGGTNYLARIRASPLNQRNPVADCGPGERFLFIDEKGRVSPCSFTTDVYGVDVLDVVSGTDIIRLASRFRDMRGTRRSTQCDDCLSTQVCDKFQAPSRALDEGRRAAT
jgi:radical SAM protein with 4Fe4S-binding SPASM domain